MLTLVHECLDALAAAMAQVAGNAGPAGSPRSVSCPPAYRVGNGMNHWERSTVI